jgi:hypothetical protein
MLGIPCSLEISGSSFLFRRGFEHDNEYDFGAKRKGTVDGRSISSD